MIKKLKRFLFFLSLLLISPLGAVSITLSVDQNSVDLEESIEAKVTIHGVQDAPPPQIKNLSAFQVQQRGKSTRIQIINGQTTRSVVYPFTLYPKREGQFLIGPATTQVQGNLLKSQQITLKVSQSSSNQQEKPYSLEAELSQPTAYLNEQVIYTFRFSTRIRLADAQFEPPTFKDFWQEELGKIKKYQKQIKGVTWLVNEFKIALFPTKVGRLKIPESTLMAEFVLGSSRHSPFDSFFGNSFFSSSRTKQVRLKTKSLELFVKPLPEEGRPPSFSGLVGKIKMNSQLSQKTMSVGDSSTLTLTLQGESNLRDAQISSSTWDKVKIYDDEPTLQISPSNGRLLGTKTFKKAIVPVSPGQFKLPPLTLNYFDPKEKEYKVLSTPEIELNVSPGKGEGLSHISAPSPSLKKRKIEILGRDIMPLKRNLKSLQSDLLHKNQKRFFFFFFGICLSLSLATWGMKKTSK